MQPSDFSPFISDPNIPNPSIGFAEIPIEKTKIFDQAKKQLNIQTIKTKIYQPAVDVVRVLFQDTSREVEYVSKRDYQRIQDLYQNVFTTEKKQPGMLDSELGEEPRVELGGDNAAKGKLPPNPKQQIEPPRK